MSSNDSSAGPAASAPSGARIIATVTAAVCTVGRSAIGVRIVRTVTTQAFRTGKNRPATAVEAATTGHERSGSSIHMHRGLTRGRRAREQDAVDAPDHPVRHDGADHRADAEPAEDPAEDLGPVAVALEHQHREDDRHRSPDDVHPGDREHPRAQETVAEEEPDAVDDATGSSSACLHGLRSHPNRDEHERDGVLAAST